ncbi:glutaredoxin domain-containing protein [Brevibacterium yomogidense]|uniref:Glutaredoxin-like protein NrdH, required for reduction of Ribonucleotide reductase class Ib n=1 Tax=Brevibacterium yomogidense TaxID=946573 RepID=A0A1X6XAL6_9MICO|nr:glutaredoxin domain-containing protein [Brevibacterium yomogidense]SLM96150.1 Glutaredoxin-like protein NrdH, required for reduction of Ribonucleotide reductase class Ib [Brevibacterium yomogidense]
MTTVIVYNKPASVQCNATYRTLENKVIAYETGDLSQDPEALEQIRAMGYMQAPVVIADEDH